MQMTKMPGTTKTGRMDLLGHKDSARRGSSVVVRAVVVLCLLGGNTVIAQTERCEHIQTETAVGLRNRQVELRFDKESGALVSLRNRVTGDEYLKDASAEGNPFRVWAGITKPYTLKPLPPYFENTTPDPQSLGGKPIEPAKCRLVDSSFERDAEAGVLRIGLQHPASRLRFQLEVRLPDEDVAADCSLTVRNDGDQAQKIMTAFPYLSGLRLGENRESNLAVNLLRCGAAGQPAWANAGGIYGASYQIAQQWQAVYEPTKDEGLGFIVMDPDIRNKAIRRFPPAGMSVDYFPPETLKPGEERRYPTVRLLVHQGNWRVVARRYRQWFEGAFKLRQPPRWIDEVDLFFGNWMPAPNLVAEAKQQPETPGAVTSFRQLPRLYVGWPPPEWGVWTDQYDLQEWCMYNELLLKGYHLTDPPGQRSIWDFYVDGTYHPRTDLGGAEALREGINRLHEMGRRIHFYVNGLDLNKDSGLIDPRMTELGLRGALENPTREKAAREDPQPWRAMCPGYEPWQDQLAETAKRLVSLGADGIRLDVYAAVFMPCYNPAHDHESPWNWNKWARQLFRKVRTAMDEGNPESSLWVEHPVDFYHEYIDGALLGTVIGFDLVPMRLSVPSLRLYGYCCGDGGATFRALNGNPGGFPHVQLDLVSRGGSGGGTGEALPWHELRPTFREAFLYGDPTDADPQAPDDPNWLGRLWRSPNYWLLVGGHLDASDLKGPTRITLPELPQQVRSAYEFDAATLKMRQAELTRTPDGIYVTVESGFGAVLLPLPDCPPLIQISDLPSVKPGEQFTVKLSAFAPWRASPPQVSVNLATPGLEPGGPTEVKLPAHTVVKVPEDTAQFRLPASFVIKVSGECLPLKRWMVVR